MTPKKMGLDQSKGMGYTRRASSAAVIKNVEAEMHLSSRIPFKSSHRIRNGPMAIRTRVWINVGMEASLVLPDTKIPNE